MSLLNEEKLLAIECSSFRNKTPFPWLNEQGFLTQEGFVQLTSNMPDISKFEKQFGVDRLYGQKTHDRWELIYRRELKELPEIWHEFINELLSAPYCSFLQKMLGIKSFSLKFHWHYSTGGGNLSPHTDSPNKIASHMFYTNTVADWDESWGGQTLILDDQGLMDYKTAPEISSFTDVRKVKTLENYSLLFQRTDHSWHALEEIKCPEGSLRKVFTVIVYPPKTIRARVRDRIKSILGQPTDVVFHPRGV